MSGRPIEWTRGDDVVSTDPSRLDVDLVHRWLSQRSYWARGVAREVVERALRHSLCFGLHRPAGQAGFARVVTDRATFAWLADVFVLEEHRGRGLGTWLVACATAHPDLQGLRRFVLATADAHALYARFGFAALRKPETWMERTVPPSAQYPQDE